MIGYLLAFSVFTTTATAQVVETSHQADFQLVPVTEELASPWGFDFLPDGRIIISEWAGPVRLLSNRGLTESLNGLPPALENAGRLDISLHPRFSENQWVYLCYFHGDLNANITRISRGRLDGEGLRDVEVVFEGNDQAESYHHNGCRIIWESDDIFLATFGDRRHLMKESQNRETTTGTIIRLHADGSIPKDNPYIDDETVRKDIWAYGVRNVQGIAQHPPNGAFWFADHGPLGGDEINVLKKGANYGWPLATYGIDYDRTIISEDEELPGVEGPLYYWRPSTAPSGLAFYTGDDFPDWQGDLFMGSLADQRLIRLELRGDRILFEEHLLEDLDQRIRAVKMGHDGYLYVLTDASPGGLYRIEPMN